MMPQITTLEEMKEYLYVAMQLEHATVPPYLTALYSIKPGTNFDAVQILRVVAVEEMLHLTIAANLLNAIGGTPDLTRPGFVPNYPAYLPEGIKDFQVCLEAFSPQAIQTFKKIERPSMAPDGVKKLVEHAPVEGRSVLGAPPGIRGMHYYSIGDFYAAIDAGLVFLEERARAADQTIFTGEAERQVTPEHYYSGGGVLTCIQDLDTAREAVRLVMEQGEGVTKGVNDRANEIAHYYRFDQIDLGQYYDPSDKDAGHPTGPKFTVDWSGVYPIKTDVKLADLPPGSDILAAAVSFNKAYGEFLKLLTDAYNGKPQLLVEAVPKMFEFRNLIVRLVRNPLPGSDLYAAPTFEIP